MPVQTIANAFSCIALHAIHGTWYTWRVPRILSLHYRKCNNAAIVRNSRRSGRIEKSAEKANEIQGQSQLSTYLPVLRLSNWLGTYVAKPQKYISRARIAAVCVEPMIIPASSGAVRRALHCYYNETRINTSRRYVIGAITFL